MKGMKILKRKELSNIFKSFMVKIGLQYISHLINRLQVVPYLSARQQYFQWLYHWHQPAGFLLLHHDEKLQVVHQLQE
jgi:hypothetical protein